MKKFLISLFVACVAFFASPGADAQIRWGAQAAFNINGLVLKQDLVSHSSSFGYSAGVIGELMFPGIGFGIDLGLGYNQSGGKINLGERLVWSSDGYGNEQVYLHNLSIPIHLRFKYTRLNGLEDIIAPFVYGGPEFNIQVAHGNCDALKYSGGDLGIGVGLGAELFKRWQVSGSYTWGMTYVFKTKLLDEFSSRTRQWSVRVAYFF